MMLDVEDIEEGDEEALDKARIAEADKNWRSISDKISIGAHGHIFHGPGPVEQAVAREMARSRPENAITHSVPRTPFKLKKSKFPKWTSRGWAMAKI